MEKLDLTVIGSGPGGYIAAIRAAQLGMRVAVVERKDLGGLCVNLGCIPSKAILKSAELLWMMKHASKYGLRADNVSANYAEVIARSRKVAERLSKGVEFLMKKNKIATFRGTARIIAPTRVLMPDRLMVRLRTLTPSIVVRIHAPKLGTSKACGDPERMVSVVEPESNGNPAFSAFARRSELRRTLSA